MGNVKPTNENIIKAVRADASLDFQNRIPDVVSNNLQKVYDALLSYAPARNEFVNSLMTRIGLQTVDSNTFRNPLSLYKKDPMRYGMTHEETYVNMTKGYAYDSNADAELSLKQFETYIMTMFHNVNLKMQYPVTVTYDNLRNAFLSETGIRDLVSAKMEACISGAELDEYTAMKGLIDTGYDKNVLPAVHVDEVVNEATAKELLAQIKQAVGEFSFPNPANNIVGATSSSPASNLIFITTPKVNARISVEALAYAFNLDKADVEVRTVVVDEFSHPAIQGVLLDVRFFNCRDQFREMTSQQLANILKWNYFYTMVEMISASPFYPIRVFTTDTVSDKLTINLKSDIPALEMIGFDVVAPDGNINLELMLIESVTGAGTYDAKNLKYEIASMSGFTKQSDVYIIPGTPYFHVNQPLPEKYELTIKISAINENAAEVTHTFRKP